ncbi:MAG: hypothetical protein EZS28_020912 [Streblomastix strix]|uniref:Uncharacterized protein n=1 Tax=Streblomastix strix TaxID=222440 RepID=A0A5J4VLU2_9EUKA|nr:MAG: hypothetical protein EZS28_020912 [Streblomastix strix]
MDPNHYTKYHTNVDWLKHAFLIKFNETEGIGAEIYGHLREQIVHLCKKLSKGETFDNTGSLAKMLSFHPLPVAASTIIFLTNCIHLPKFSGFQYIPLWFVVWIGIFTIKVFGSLQFMHYVKNRVNSSEAQ